MNALVSLFTRKGNKRQKLNAVTMVEAAVEGHLSVVADCLRDGVSPDDPVLDRGESFEQIENIDDITRDVDGVVTASACAAYRGHLDVLQLLQQNGADLNATDKRGWGVAHSASAGNRLAILRWLTEQGCDLGKLYESSESCTEGPMTPLDLVSVHTVDETTSAIVVHFYKHGQSFSAPIDALLETKTSEGEREKLTEAIDRGETERAEYERAICQAICLAHAKMPLDVAKLIAEFVGVKKAK